MRKIIFGAYVTIFCVVLIASYIGLQYNHNPMTTKSIRTYTHKDGTHSHAASASVFLVQDRKCPSGSKAFAPAFVVMARDSASPGGWRMEVELETEENRYRVPSPCSDEPDSDIRPCEDRELAYPIVFCEEEISES